LPAAAPELAAAARRSIEELRALGRVLPAQENRDYFLAWLRRFFLTFAVPHRSNVAPDDRPYHQFILAVLKGAGVHSEMVEGYPHNPKRLTEILAKLPEISWTSTKSVPEMWERSGAC
jgi:hypothetical protein